MAIQRDLSTKSVVLYPFSVTDPRAVPVTARQFGSLL